ncbi:hypothetical protein HNV12_00690 [Methanococcoides sp. SA1]|nr:hypothetical protein [Methanococcoides sp. SA1]
MRSLLRPGKDKSALSNLVAYVLLISITISLSVLVYGWLRFYVSQEDVVSCPENVNLIISSYDCVSGVNGGLNLSLKNKGLFSVDGFIVRVHDRPDADFGFYTFDDEGERINPGETKIKFYPFVNQSDKTFTDLTLVEIQPYLEGEDAANCESYAFQRVDCN